MDRGKWRPSWVSKRDEREMEESGVHGMNRDINHNKFVYNIGPISSIRSRYLLGARIAGGTGGSTPMHLLS